MLCNVNPLVDGESSIKSSSAGLRITGTRRPSSIYRSRLYFSFQRYIRVRGIANERPSHSFGSAGKEHHNLLYNSAAYFLALAIADNALLHIKSLEDLLEMEIPAGQDEIDLIFEESVLDLPILRKCTKGKDTTEEIMPKEAFLRIFQATLKKTGYFCGSTIHAVRRYLGKKIDGKPLSLRPFSSVCSFLCKVGGISRLQIG